MALEFPQDDWRIPNNQDGRSAAESEFFLLMSLALDGMLDAEEEERFHRYIATDSSLADEWQVWQGLNARFDDEPSIAPPASFVDNVIGELAMQENSEAYVLMSLALDGLLSAEERERLNRYTEQDPLLANEWQRWQDLGNSFDEEPSIMPPIDFVDKVAAGLVFQQRRSKLRLGIFVGAITTATWLLLVLALVGAGAYVALYQGPWVGQQIANLTILTSNVAAWFSIASQNLNSVLNLAVAPYQMWGIVLAYVLAAGLVLSLWTRMLRRSVDQRSMGQVAAS